MYQNDFDEKSLKAAAEGESDGTSREFVRSTAHHFPRLEFGSLVKNYQAERAAKGFDCWTQFVPCGSTSWVMPIRFARSATGWPAAWQVAASRHCHSLKPVHLVVHQPTWSRRTLPGFVLKREQQGLGPRKRDFHFRNKLLPLDSNRFLSSRIFPFRIASSRERSGGLCGTSESNHEPGVFISSISHHRSGPKSRGTPPFSFQQPSNRVLAECLQN